MADPALNATQNDALGQMKNYLGQFKMDDPDMLNTVKGWIVNGYSTDRVKLEIPNTPQFQQQFPEYKARIDAGLPPMSPVDILNYRSSATQLLRDAGLPPGFYDSPDDFVDLVVKNLSPAELQGRIKDGYASVANAPQAVQDTFAEYFGAKGPDMLATFFLDPTKGGDFIQKAVTEAKIGGAGSQYGFNINQSAAEAYAAQGITGAQAQQGFQQADQMKPLAEETISEQGDLTNEQLAQGVLTGGDAAAATKRRAQERSAQFRQAYGGAGGGSQGQRGIGVGGAPQT